MKFNVYTYFGRVLKSFVVPKDETHHNTLEQAREFIVKTELNGTKCWIKYIPLC